MVPPSQFLLVGASIDNRSSTSQSAVVVELVDRYFESS